MNIVGIDPSLAGTGIALIDTEDRLVIDVKTIASTGKAGATLDQRHTRLHNLRLDIGLAAHPDPKGPVPDLVVLEAPSLGQARQGGTLDRHGLWWLIVDWFHTYSNETIPVIAVSPAQRAKYATGKGNAPKDEVLAAVVRRYPHVNVRNNNEADALILAAMGARRLGHPIEDSLPISHLDAMTKIAWPEWVAA